MASGAKVVETLDHPILFVLATGAALWGLAGVITHLAKRTGQTGLASFVQNP